VPRSSDLSAVLGLAGGCAVVCLITQTAAAAARTAIFDAAHGTFALTPYGMLTASALAPCIGSAAGAMLACAVVSGGITVHSLRLDFTKLDAAAGLRRMLSSRSALNALRTLVAACVATMAMLWVVLDAFSWSGIGVAEESVAALLLRAGQRILVTSVAVGLLFGVGDVLVERLLWRRRLRMSLDELKRDLKQTEGDPELRNRRRTQHRALIRGSLSRLPDATFVVANPTHVAVALEYRPPSIAVPRVLVRAVDAGARIVKARARVLGIPIIENVVLAHTLLATTHVDEAIPRACYLAVARIVAGLQSECGTP
jgi:flagellar biosynthesis protein FlhB